MKLLPLLPLLLPPRKTAQSKGDCGWCARVNGGLNRTFVLFASVARREETQRRKTVTSTTTKAGVFVCLCGVDPSLLHPIVPHQPITLQQAQVQIQCLIHPVFDQITQIRAENAKQKQSACLSLPSPIHLPASAPTEASISTSLPVTCPSPLRLCPTTSLANSSCQRCTTFQTLSVRQRRHAC